MTTHPVLVESVCRVLKDFGVSTIDISDSPAIGSLFAVAKKAGYGDLPKRYGAKIIPLTDPTPLISQDNIAHIKIAGNIKEYDHVINLPKFKAHCQMTLTLSIKNLFGLVIGKRKPVLHCLVKNNKVTFGKMLIDIARHVSPTLTIIDGITAMQGNGPINGTPHPLGILAAGQDMVALDRVLTEIVNVPIDQMHVLEAARIKNYGTLNLEQIKLVCEQKLDSLKVTNFKLANFPVDISFNPLRLIKSFSKQFYEIRVNEKLTSSR